uniref:Uncharacterized protein n=1 Tax=Pyxicephalus adspersus TaxID=30357 RepID=A0AAV3ACL8_PYXAD|nr:TPA: hypothetical protein GDO54_011265 [Pyxicephalus adspersus]
MFSLLFSCARCSGTQKVVNIGSRSRIFHAKKQMVEITILHPHCSQFFSLPIFGLNGTLNGTNGQKCPIWGTDGQKKLTKV